MMLNNAPFEDGEASSANKARKSYALGRGAPWLVHLRHGRSASVRVRAKWKVTIRAVNEASQKSSLVGKAIIIKSSGSPWWLGACSSSELEV